MKPIHPIRRPFVCSLLLFAFAAPAARSADVASETPVMPDRHNVVWTSPSKDEHGSMPVGNGDLAANVWVEENGDLVFYVAKSDAWSENGRLLKLGRLRVRTDPPLYAAGDDFRQELVLRDGVVSVKSGGKKLLFWIDAKHPAIRIDIESPVPLSARVSLEIWRTKRRELMGQELNSARGLMTRHAVVFPVIVEPDTVLPAEGDALRWCHRNTRSCYPITLEKQHLADLLSKYPDPLLNRTFGGVVQAPNMKASGDRTLVSAKPARAFHISVTALTAQTPTLGAWTEAIGKLAGETENLPRKQALAAHREWWNAFWSRSWLDVTGTPEAETVARAYVLQRWMNACAGRGAEPIKFNGSLFTVGAPKNRNGGPYDADYRRWGGCYWFQNTRLIYYPMPACGDFDLMEPLWRMYRQALPLLRERTRRYFGHGGLHCGETMYFWGTYCNYDFGWNNKGVLAQSGYLRYYWDSTIELSHMMLEYFRHTLDERFARKTLIPFAGDAVAFYAQHYKTGPDGKILFSPAMSLETWHSADDPLPVVAGLSSVLRGLLGLPEHLTSAEQRTHWKEILAKLPALPIGEADGKRWLKPARRYSHKANVENPELYAVFPYRMFTMHKPDRDIALETWKRRLNKRSGCWHQDPIQAALLGLGDEAKRDVVANSKAGNRSCRFPVIWGPGHDWLPDQDHGGVTMTALQLMLMQCEDGKIHLLPAWPKDWNATFKLHAPGKTVVRGTVQHGKLADWSVTPASRRKDVVRDSSR
jgi:hypothetical protein